MKIQIIIAALTTSLLIAQDDRRPDPVPPRPPGEGELPFPPPRQPRGDGEQPRPFRPDSERPRDFVPGDPNQPQPFNRGPLKLQPYVGLVTRPTGPELAAQLKQPEGFGLIVEDVLDESPAKTAGLERNDVVQKLDDQWLVNPPQFEALIRRAGKGAEVSLTILRGGAEQKISVKVGEKMMPERRPMRVFDPSQGELRQPRDGFGPRESQPRPVESRIEDVPRGAGELRPVRDGVRMIRRDDAGSYEIANVEGRRIFTMKKPDGSVAWTGPVGTPEERAAMPEDARRKFEELEKNRPVPRPAPVIRREDGQQPPVRPRDPESAR